jgi:hypothetical protein
MDEEHEDGLHRQRNALICSLSELRDRLGDDRQAAAVVAGVRVDLRNWMEQYQAHREAEADALQSVVS